MALELSGRKVELPSGAVLYVNPARYEDTEEFLGAFLESVAGLPSNFQNEDGTINSEVIKLVSELSVSKVFINPKLKACMWKCLAYCLYVTKGGQAPEKVNVQLFDGKADRADLATVFYECAYENFLPFLSGLWNVSGRLQDQIKSTLK